MKIEIKKTIADLKVGDKYTIEGFKITKKGKIKTKCKPGKETAYIVKEVHTGDIK